MKKKNWGGVAQSRSGRLESNHADVLVIGSQMYMAQLAVCQSS